MLSNGSLASPLRRPVERPSTEIVHSLFGAAVGRCWGDFSCSHYRQRGRMYAASNAIGFFSNLFGFERRICLLLDDVTDIKAFRTTSIQVTTTEGEQYIFKSFENRELVVLLLLQLKQGHANGTTREAVPGDEGDSARLDPLETSMEVDETVKEEWKESLTTIETMSSTVPEGDEQPESPSGFASARAHESDTESVTTDGAIAKSPTAPTPDESEDNPVENSDLENSTEILPETATLEQEWELAKNGEEHSETTIDGLLLPCTLDEFFALFLADNAPHSIDSYQRDSIGDSELTISPWTTDSNDANIHCRVISFRHPLPNNLGMGPPSALTERQQRFRRFGSYGFCLEASTSVKGVIASDCFFVDDKWIVESAGETNVMLTVKHQVRFTKRTMLKRVIQNTSNAEAHTWYEGYTRMLLSSLKDKQGTDDMSTADERANEENDDSIAAKKIQSNVSSAPFVITLLLALLFGCVLLGMAFLILQMLSMNNRMASLEDEVSRLREENALALARLAEAVGSMKAATQVMNRTHSNENYYVHKP